MEIIRKYSLSSEIYCHRASNAKLNLITFFFFLEDYSVEKSLPVRISSFLALFRQFLPDLHNYFEEEAVDMRELATTWLQWLFAKEMQIGMLMRLWGKLKLCFFFLFEPNQTSFLFNFYLDVYFSIPDPLDLHQYVCLAILTTCKDALEELDQSEVRSMLLSLPPMDVERVSLIYFKFVLSNGKLTLAFVTLS